MVRILRLDEHDTDVVVEPPHAAFGHLKLDPYTIDPAAPHVAAKGFFEATAFYPVASQLATCLDLTSLDHLSQTCRQIRHNLLQHRSALMSQTLRCKNDGVEEVRFPCARDLVSPCQKCGMHICRNCITKPMRNTLHNRHRRLCKTCMRAPLAKLMITVEHEHDEQHTSHDPEHQDTRALYHGPCTCEEELWFCEPCSHQQRSEDIKYMRGWNWRRRYSHTGIGIGEGEQGVPCGREGKCMAVREVEVEIDALIHYDPRPALSPSRTRSWSSNTSYLTQEIEGIGGVVKKKVKKRVQVGQVVKEYEEEREDGEYLRREQTGQNRSWCAHCDRVIKGKRDEVEEGHVQLQRVSSSSASSTSTGSL